MYQLRGVKMSVAQINIEILSQSEEYPITIPSFFLTQ